MVPAVTHATSRAVSMLQALSTWHDRSDPVVHLPFGMVEERAADRSLDLRQQSVDHLVVGLHDVRVHASGRAGVDDRERQVVLDVGVHPGNGVLDRFATAVARLEQRLPGGRDRLPGVVSLDRRKPPAREADVEVREGLRVGRGPAARPPVR